MRALAVFIILLLAIGQITSANIGDTVIKTGGAWVIASQTYIDEELTWEISGDTACWKPSTDLKAKDLNKLDSKIKDKSGKTKTQLAVDLASLDKAPLKDDKGAKIAEMDYSKDGCVELPKDKKTVKAGFGTTTFIYHDIEISLELLSNTDQCLIDCHAEYQVDANDTLTPDMLDTIFKDSFGQDRELPYSIEMEKTFTREETRYSTTYTDCEDENGTITTCEEMEPYTVSIDYQGWAPLEDIESGKIRISGQKSAWEDIDHIPEIAGVSFPEFAWWNSTWLLKAGCNITTGSASSLTNFTGYCRMDTTALISAGKMKPDCSDLRVVDSTETAELDYEIEACNTTATVIWVRLPTTTAGGTDELWIYYNNSAASDAQDPTGTWSAYEGVWHFDDASGNATDSLNKNHLEPKIGGSGTIEYGINSSHGTGMRLKMVGAQTNYARLSKAGVIDLPQGSANFTTIIWMNGTGALAPGSCFFRFGDWAANENVYLNFLLSPQVFRIGGYSINSQTTVDWAPSSAWQFFALNSSVGTNISIWTNGSLGGTWKADVANLQADYMDVAGNSEAATDRTNMSITELRIMNGSASADWITATYAQTYVMGAEESGTGLPPSISNETIGPSPAYTTNDIYCSLYASDDDSALLNITALWFKDGVNVLNGSLLDQTANQTFNFSLLSGNTTQGETWYCDFIVGDGTANTTSNTTNLTISNHIPYLTQPALSPLSPFYDEDIECSFTVYDEDLDALTAIVYWLKDDLLQNDLNMTQPATNGSVVIKTLAYGNISVGDRWRCNASVSDGFDSNDSLSDEATVKNHTWPTVIQVTPLGGAVTNSASNVFTFRCEDSETASLTGSLLLDGGVVSTTTCANDSNCQITYATVQQCNIHTWQARCEDGNGRINTSSALNLDYQPVPVLSGFVNASEIDYDDSISFISTAGCQPHTAYLAMNETNHSMVCASGVCSYTNSSRDAFVNYSVYGLMRSYAGIWYQSGYYMFISLNESYSPIEIKNTLNITSNYTIDDYITFNTEFVTDWGQYILGILVLAVAFVLGNNYVMIFLSSGIGLVFLSFIFGGTLLLSGGILLIVVALIIKYAGE